MALRIISINLLFCVLNLTNAYSSFQRLFLQSKCPSMKPSSRGEGAYLAKRFQPVCQQEELVGATLLRLGRTDESFL